MTTTKGDGRNARAVATRDAILKGCREAMAAGCWRPSVNVVASLANRSVRSVYDHFAEVETLYREALSNGDTRDAISGQIKGVLLHELPYVIVDGHHPDWPTSETAKRAHEQRRGT